MWIHQEFHFLWILSVSFNHVNMNKYDFPLKIFKIPILKTSLWFDLEESNQLDTPCSIYLLVTKSDNKIGTFWE